MIELLLKRRSIRKYSDRVIEPEKTGLLLKAALLSPSAKNLHSAEFIVVENKGVLKLLSQAKPNGGTFLEEAALGIVIIGDTEKTEVWIEDASIAAMNIQMEAESIGLGSCWIHIRNRKHDDGSPASDFIKKQLGIPSNYEVEAIISIGYKAEASKNHSLSDLDKSRIHHNKF